MLSIFKKRVAEMLKQRGYLTEQLVVQGIKNLRFYAQYVMEYHNLTISQQIVKTLSDAWTTSENFNPYVSISTTQGVVYLKMFLEHKMLWNG